MKNRLSVVLTAILALILAGCGGGKDNPTPDTAALLTRTWAFTDITVTTDARTYPIRGIRSDYDEITFGKDGACSYLAVGDYVSLPRQRVTGTWTLLGQTLTVVDADKRGLVWTIKTIDTARVELVSQRVTDNQGVYTPEERNLVSKAAILFNLQDKVFGGTLDITGEPEPRAYQIFINLKAQ